MAGMEGLAFLGGIPAALRDKLLAAAELREIAPGEVLIKESRSAREFFVVSEGVLEVRRASWGETALTRLGPGAVVGELGFVLGHRTSAEVVAIERTMVLRFAADELRDLLANDEPLAAAFWKSLSQALAARVVRTSADAALVLGPDQERAMPELLANTLGGIGELLARFDAGPVDDADALADQAILDLGRAIDSARDEGVDDATLFALVRPHVIPALGLSVVGKRIWEKPHGYAGDWETIEHVYRNEPEGVGEIGRVLDGAMLRISAGQALRNRRGLLAAEIARSADDGPAAIMSLACGPAREVFDVLESQPELVREVNLLDIDKTAIDHVRDRATTEGFSDKVNVHEANLIKLGLGQQELDIGPQDLVYSIGLIDYFADELVVALLNLVHGWLGPGGRVILGNFHPDNVNRSFMDMLDWPLIHRTEADMNRLYQDSLFGAPCHEILWEDEHINLFAVGIKQ